MLPYFAGELTNARTEYLAIMTDSAVIQRKERVDQGNGQVEDKIISLGPYPCRVVDLRVNRPIELAQGAQISAVMVEEICLPHGTQVLPADVIVVNNTVRYEDRKSVV